MCDPLKTAKADNNPRQEPDESLGCTSMYSDFEWDEYPGPLWDSLEIEVELLVKEYFEQADADLAEFMLPAGRLIPGV